MTITVTLEVGGGRERGKGRRGEQKKIVINCLRFWKVFLLLDPFSYFLNDISFDFWIKSWEIGTNSEASSSCEITKMLYLISSNNLVCVNIYLYIYIFTRTKLYIYLLFIYIYVCVCVCVRFKRVHLYARDCVSVCTSVGTCV